YASTVWSPTISDSNLQKLQITQNNALRVITGCTSDTNIEHLHKETKTLPLPNHLKLHASQLRQKAQLPIHPLNDLTQQTNCPRKMKETIFQNWNRKTINIDNNLNPPTPESISNNIKTIHTLAVSECLTSYTNQIQFYATQLLILIHQNNLFHAKLEEFWRNYVQTNHQYSKPTYTKLTPNLVHPPPVHYAIIISITHNTFSHVQKSSPH